MLAVGGAAVFAFFASGKAFEKGLLLSIVVACLMPHEITSRGIRVELLMFGATAFFFLNRSARPPTAERPNQAMSGTERWFLLLLTAATIGAAIGFNSGHPLPNVISEYALYLQFALAVVVIRSGLSERWIKYLLWAMLLATVLVSLSYLNMFAASNGRSRAVSDQQHLLNVAIPVLCAFLLLAKSGKERLVAGVLLLPMIPATYVTQTRALWLYIPFSVALLAVIVTVRRQMPVRRLIIMGVTATAVALVILGYATLTRGASAGHEAIASRAETLRDLSSDLSLASRVDLAFQALARVARNPILGSGLGDWLHYRIIPMRDRIFFMDFSYMWVLWKLGIIGLAPLLGLYLLFMKRVWFVYRRTRDHFQRCVAAGVLVSFVALLMIGFESGILVIYRFNLVWASLMGIFELWKQRIESEATSPVLTERNTA
jgi:O-antigen ligase